MSIIPISSVPPGSNIIGSHVSYRVKTSGEIKARICPWGNLDAEKPFLRCDCPSINMEVLRILASIAVEMGWKISSLDAVAAFLQADGFERIVFIRPPREENSSGLVWRLLAAAYGLGDSGRLWYLTSNTALCKDYGLSKSKTEPTLYYLQNKDGRLQLLVLVQVDNYIITGENDAVSSFEKFLKNAFRIGTSEQLPFTVYGTEIEMNKCGSIILSQRSKLEEIYNHDLSGKLDSSRSGNDVANPSEIKCYRSLLGKILFVGRMSHPPLLRIASEMAGKLPTLLVHHLKDLQAQISQTKQHKCTLNFKHPSESRKFYLDVYSDAKMISKGDCGAREGYIIFRRSGDAVHPLYWISRKLRRVARSSSTAEILAAADACDKAMYIRCLLHEIHYSHTITMSTDSRSTFNLVTKIKEPEESMNKVDLA